MFDESLSSSFRMRLLQHETRHDRNAAQSNALQRCFVSIRPKKSRCFANEIRAGVARSRREGILAPVNLLLVDF